MFAKKNIPRGFRIIVDRAHKSIASHPALLDLAPVGGSAAEKWRVNHVDGDSICVRLSRAVIDTLAKANHACNPNASHATDDDRKVEILFAERDIRAGEEITISYTLWNEIYCTDSAEEARKNLREKWGFECPQTCFCRKPENIKTVMNGRALYKKMADLLNESTRNVISFTQNSAQLLALEKLPDPILTLVSKTVVLHNAFHITAGHSSTFVSAGVYLKQLYELKTMTHHPDSKEIADMERIISDFKSRGGRI
eukprot:jgi/Hompol1/6123/HPOL_000716-RA